MFLSKVSLFVMDALYIYTVPLFLYKIIHVSCCAEYIMKQAPFLLSKMALGEVCAILHAAFIVISTECKKRRCWTRTFLSRC
jgi:hypothetical protein